MNERDGVKRAARSMVQRLAGMDGGTVQRWDKRDKYKTGRWQELKEISKKKKYDG